MVRHRRRERVAVVAPVIAAGTVVGLVLFVVAVATGGSRRGGVAGDAPTTPTATEVTTIPPTTVSTTTTTLPPPSTTTEPTLPTRNPGEVPAWTVGMPWGTTAGLTMFRGNPTRSWYGTGPLPSVAPEVLWRYPDRAMCASSSVGGESKVWCGTGWTGQPVVWERPDGRTEIIFGAYDRAVHFVDAETGADLMPPFPTGDIIKGSVTLDPDGYPLLYFGSRDNKLRIVALDGDRARQLWALDAHAVAGIWNDDWDGNPVVVDDVLYEGGENGWFYAVKLDRAFGIDGKVAVQPQVVFQTRGWTSDLVAKVGRNVSIESSVAVSGDRVYFTNSGGRVAGFDVSHVLEGKAPLVFDYWVGDDVDASLVVDGEGMLYVAAEYERFTARSKELGQLIKLDPSRGDDAFVWGIPVRAGNDVSGIWATPALGDGVLYVNTQPGDLIAVDAATGELVWSEEVGWHSWSSPAVVDGKLLDATCTGELRAYDLGDPRQPEPLWSLKAAGGCIESTPAVWDGRIYVGSRDGYVRAYG